MARHGRAYKPPTAPALADISCHRYQPRSLQNARASAPLTRGAARAQIKNPDKGPTLRTGHSLVVSGLPNNPKAVIIGGCTAEGVVNEVWNLKLGVETLEWEKPKIGQPDKAPSPRWRHTANLLRASPRARPTTPTTPRRCALS